MSDGVRAEAMARRIVRTAGRLGIDEAGCRLLRTAFDLGMAPRVARRLDDHHPDYLHPARTALILMDDARVDHSGVLAVALMTETRDPALQVDPEALRHLDPALTHLAAEVPVPEAVGDTLLEALVTVSRDAAMIAVAERLDHARHLHLRERDEWEPYHATTCAAYAPLARRVQPALAGRIDWWCTTFQQRFLAE